MPAQETCNPAFPDQERPMLSYGLSYTAACRKHVDALGVSRVFVIASGTIARTTDLLKDLQAALGDRLAGTKTGLKPHTFLSECLEVVREVNELHADCIVTLGGGSLSDAAKFISFAHANEVVTREDALKLPHMIDPAAPSKASDLPVILIPTTLSAGEYSRYAGVTDDTDAVKYQFILHYVDVVILSGDLGTTVPLSHWLTTGVRAIDHCCEAICYLTNTKNKGISDKAAMEGLRDVVPGLLRTAKSPDDADARLQCLLGAAKSATMLHYGVYFGASHGIGHMLGPTGVAHGHTSCVLMTAVHKYNKTANEPRQQVVCETLWSIAEAEALFIAKGLERDTADLGDLLDVIVRALGMPRSLKEVGVEGEERLWEVARNSMMDPCVDQNPVKIRGPEQVMEILRACAYVGW